MTKQPMESGHSDVSQAFFERPNLNHPIAMVMAPTRCGASFVLVSFSEFKGKSGKQHSKGYRKPTPWPSK